MTPFNTLKMVSKEPEAAEREMHESAKNGDWDHALYVAHGLPVHWGAFEKLPQYGIPEKHAEKILDTLSNEYSPHHRNLPNFLFEYSQNLRPNVSPEHLSRVAHMGKDDVFVTRETHQHPNWLPDKDLKGRMSAANFWSDYESHVKPSHFAAVGSLFSGNHEIIRDHRGNSGTSEEYKDAIPHLKQHASEVQKEIMKDEFIPKRWFNGHPHIKLWRGVGGNYGKMIRDKAQFDPNSNEVNHVRMRIPSAAFSSWSAEPELAKNFAHTRDDIENQPKKQGVVVSRWVPLRDVLHSGFHKVVTGQNHPHFNEYEVVVGHPRGHIDVSTKDMEFVRHDHPFGETAPAKIRDQKVQKGLKEVAAAGAIMAGSMLMPQTVAIHPADQRQQQQQQQKSPFLPRGTHPMDSFLDTISQLETSGGKNLKHKPSKGFHGGAVAVGDHAIMPLTAQYVAKHSKNALIRPLAEMAPHDVGKRLQADPDLTHEVAREYATSLHSRFKGNKPMMAHAWRHGPNAAVDPADVALNPYVAAFQTAHAAKPIINEVQGKLKKLQGMVKPK